MEEARPLRVRMISEARFLVVPKIRGRKPERQQPSLFGLGSCRLFPLAVPMRLSILGLLPVLAVLATSVGGGSQVRAPEREPPFIAFPESAGEADGLGLSVRHEGGSCTVEESTGHEATDAFACAVGPAQQLSRDGRTYALTWTPPRYEGVYSPAAAVPPAVEQAPPRLGRNSRSRVLETHTLVQRLAIDETGRVTACAIESSSGDANLDASTCEMELSSRYVPATLDGAAVAETRYLLVEIVSREITTTTPLH